MNPKMDSGMICIENIDETALIDETQFTLVEIIGIMDSILCAEVCRDYCQ
jgi:hypothetical protein